MWGPHILTPGQRVHRPVNTQIQAGYRPQLDTHNGGREAISGYRQQQATNNSWIQSIAGYSQELDTGNT
jgi:hypothetical protein